MLDDTELQSIDEIEYDRAVALRRQLNDLELQRYIERNRHLALVQRAYSRGQREEQYQSYVRSAYLALYYIDRT